MLTSRLSLQIRCAQNELSEQLQVTESLTNYLFEQRVFEESEVMRVRFAVTPSDKANHVVRILQTRSDEDISKFILKLKEPGSQPSLAEEILGKAIKEAEKELTADSNTARSTKRMEDWTVDDVSSWLKSIQQDDQVIETFKSEMISGDVLSTLTMTDIESFCPAAKFGDRNKIVRNRDKELKKETEKRATGKGNTDTYVSKKFPNFGRRGSSAIPYCQFACFSKESATTDNLLEPVHAYFDLKDVDAGSDGLFRFSVEVVPFICACLNERSNGTCHFGVDGDGVIHGIPADEEQFQKVLNGVIETCFSRDQLEIVGDCVRPVRLVEVKRKGGKVETSGRQLFVVEVDVVPVHRLCTDEAFFARAVRRDLRSTERRDYEIPTVYRFHEGLVVGCSGETLRSFMESKVEIANKRREVEMHFLQEVKHEEKSDFPSEKLTRLLHSGRESLVGDVYPIFVLSPDTGGEESVGKIQFLQAIENKTVFDFDSASSNRSVFIRHEELSGDASRVLSVEYFDSGRKDVSEMLDDCSQPWIFCNGCERINEMVLGATEWKLKRRPALSKGVEIFHDAIPKEHGIVIFLLFSDNFDALLSAAEEFCLRFKWMVISESQQLASKFKEHVIKTLKIQEEEFERRCIVGMSWFQIGEVFAKINGDFPAGQMELPTSAGSKVTVSRKVLNEMTDLEVLGSTHLSGAAIALSQDAEKLIKLKADAEQRFYQGGEVDWWNFWFKDQVLTRDLQPQIVSCIQRLFTKQQREADDRVDVVAIYHLPGSGATTIAKHALWQLKDQYRCTVIRSITRDTHIQLTRLHTYHETCNPKPVLVLLDNYDEVQIQDLKTALELESHNLARDIERPPPVPFVLLVCMRCCPSKASQPVTSERRFELGHSLSVSELQWFRAKYEQMETEWQSKRLLDPSQLISVNIFRQNFDRHFVESRATSFVKFVTTHNERLLLKYVAFVGAYDPEFRCIPASCFDQFMNDTRPFESPWMDRLSESLKVLLLSAGSKSGAGFPMKKIRIAHSLLAHHIFREVISENETAADVMLELLNSDLLQSKDVARKQLLKIITSLLTRRVRERDGEYKQEFSPLIQSVIEANTQNGLKVINMFRRALELDENHFLAEKLARFCAYAQDWSLAEEWVVYLTEKYPTTETVWNTCGLVYREHLLHRFQQTQQRTLTAEEVESSLGLLRRAIEMFQKEQNVRNDLNGLVCEGDVILVLIDAFKRIIGFQEVELQRFLFDCDYVPSWLSSWKHESIVYVRGLVVRIIHISEEIESYGENIFRSTLTFSIQDPRIKKNRELVIKLNEGFRNYFECDSTQFVSGLSPEAGAHYRRRQIFILKGNTLVKSLEQCRNGGIATLEQIKLLAEKNLKMPNRNPSDVQTFVRTTLLIFITSGNRTDNSGNDLFVTLKQMIQELVSIGETSESDQIHIETYLYFCLLNWPTSAGATDPETVPLLKTIVEKWDKAVEKRNVNRVTRTYTSRVLFSIGAGSNLSRIFIDRGNIICPVWFRGVVTSDGKKVTYTFNGHQIEIRLDVVQHRSRWETSVFFRIGFTWSGPLAFDMALEDPGVPSYPVPVVPCQPEIPVVPCQPEIPVLPCQPEIHVVPCPPVVPPQPVAPPAPCPPQAPPCARKPHHHHHHHHHHGTKHHCHNKHKKHHC